MKMNKRRRRKELKKEIARDFSKALINGRVKPELLERTKCPRWRLIAKMREREVIKFLENLRFRGSQDGSNR